MPAALFFVKEMIGFVFLILVGITVFAILLYLFQDSLIFIPDSNITLTPTDVGLKYEEVFFSTVDNVRLHGWYVAAEGQKLIVLLSHGNGGNISHRLEKIKILNSAGLGVFIYDYRGYGKSEGKPSERGTYLDAMAAWEYMVKTKGITPHDIVLYGESLGSAVSIEIATKLPVGALIIEAPFTSLRELAQRLFPYLPARYLCKYDYDSDRKVLGLKMPKLFIHAVDDEVVPFSMGKRLFDSSAAPKEFLELIGGHNGAFYISSKGYAEGIRNFIEGHLKTHTTPSKT